MRNEPNVAEPLCAEPMSATAPAPTRRLPSILLVDNDPLLLGMQLRMLRMMQDKLHPRLDHFGVAASAAGRRLSSMNPAATLLVVVGGFMRTVLRRGFVNVAIPGKT